MSRKKRELSDDEKQLWRRVASSVKPRRASVERAEKPVAGKPPPKAAAPVQPRATAKAPPPAPAPVANRGAEKRVRRGKLEIDATLDLHGYTQDGAFTALATFLHSAQRRGGRVALVVTGVGRAGQGVLKARLPDWLSGRELKPLVSGFAQAHRSHGGAGAFYVFLKRA